MGTFTDKEDYYRHLRDRGYESLGKGLYSYVVAKPGSDRVIKIGQGFDAWPGYVEWCIINGYMGTFGPKVYSLRYYPDFYVAVVERLVCTMNEIARESGYRKTSYNRLHDKMQVWRWGRFGDPFDDEYQDLKEFCRKCAAAHFANDLHSGNVMLRKDGQIVVTDPCSGYRGPEELPRYKY